jgi:capsid protein
MRNSREEKTHDDGTPIVSSYGRYLFDEQSRWQPDRGELLHECEQSEPVWERWPMEEKALVSGATLAPGKRNCVHEKAPSGQR